MFLEDKILALTFNLSTFYTVLAESEEYKDAKGNQSQSIYHAASSCCCVVVEQCRLWGHERFLFWLRQYGMHDPPTILLLEAVRVVFVKGKLRIPVSFMISLVMIVMGSGDGFGGFQNFRMEGDKDELSESSEPTLCIRGNFL